MKKSTIITIVAFVLGIIILGTGFVLLTDNNISKKFRELMNKTTASTTTTTTTTTKPPRWIYLKKTLVNTLLLVIIKI